MKSSLPSPPADIGEEVTSLIATLQRTEQRLEELTAGEVDAVIGSDGDTFLLRRAQAKLREDDAARQTSILNALPAYTALLDPFGCIVSVNESWRRHASESMLQDPGADVGVNYLELCETASGSQAGDAHRLGAGIRAVLAADVASFSLEYCRQLSTQQHWFLVTVTPLASARPRGVVVMHVDITARKLAELRLERLNRLHAVLSKVGEAIVQKHDRRQLYEAVCRIVVEYGLLRMVFVGEVDRAANVVRAVASAGAGLDYLRETTSVIPMDGGPLTEGTVGTALRTGKWDACNDIANAPRMKPWRKSALHHGLLSCASFPLYLRGSVASVLVLYAGEFDYFLDDEIALMNAVAEGLSYALDAQDTDLERRRAEENALRSATLLSIAGRVSRTGAWALEVPSMKLTWSPETLDIQELPADYVPTLAAALGFYPTEHQARMAAAVEACVTAGTPFDVEAQLDTAKGRRIWVRSIGESERGPDGRIHRIHGAFRDINDQKVAEEAFRELAQRTERRERMLTTTLSSLSDFAYSYDRQGRFLFVNQPLLDLWGLTLEEAVGRNFLELGYPPDLAAKLQRQVQQVFETGRSLTDETEYTSPTGVHGCYEYIFSPAFAADGAVEVVVGSTRDITERKRAEETLQLQQIELRTLFDLTPAQIWFKDTGNRFLRVNQRVADAVGMPIEAIEGKSAVELFPQEAAAYYADDLEVIRSGAPKLGIVEQLRDAKAEARWVQTDKVPCRDKDGNVVGLLALVQDISERKAAENRIRYLNRVYAVLSGINTLIVRVRSRDALFQEACRIAIDAGGFRVALVGLLDCGTLAIRGLACQDNDAELVAAFKASVLAGNGTPADLSLQAINDKEVVVSRGSQSDPGPTFCRPGGGRGPRALAILPLFVGGAVTGILALGADDAEFFHAEELKLLTELAGDIAFAVDHIDKQEKLDYLAYYDELTGLANRRLFLERTGQYVRTAVAEGHRLALVVVDLERFKNINDSLGQKAGDTLLKEVARWMTGFAGDANLISRIEADHFAVVLPVLKDGEDLPSRVADTATALTGHPFRLDGAVYRIGAKFGAAVFPGDGSDADTLFRNAEAALKKAKATGERYLMFSPQMTEKVAGELTLENQLRYALENHEFVLHYQPKINLESGKVTGAEALIRWNDPRTGLVPPARFIPVLEATGLIHEVGRWALRQAIADNMRWRKTGLTAMRISVNVSPLQLRRRDFLAEIERNLAIDPHAAAGLDLEITESVIMEDVKHNVGLLQAIRAMGVRIAIDDFGTGFSSLSHLARLPVDELKIDRSFVLGMTESPQELSLVSTIVDLAHSLKLNVVAEGVEDKEQSRLLRLLGCDEMQGFLISKPLPCEEFEPQFLLPSSAR